MASPMGQDPHSARMQVMRRPNLLVATDCCAHLSSLRKLSLIFSKGVPPRVTNTSLHNSKSYLRVNTKDGTLGTKTVTCDRHHAA